MGREGPSSRIVSGGQPDLQADQRERGLAEQVRDGEARPASMTGAGHRAEQHAGGHPQAARRPAPASASPAVERPLPPRAEQAGGGSGAAPPP